MNTKKEILNRYRKTPKGVITDMYNHHKYRNRKNGFGEVGYTLKWLQEKYLTDKLFLRLFDEWVKSGYEKAKKPTIDRINNKKGYEKDNIHLLSWSENRFKQNMERRCRKGRVLQKLNGVLINIWKSQRDIVKTLGLGQAMLSMALTGKYKTAYGFEWEYENNIHENADLLKVGGK
jgi:hypothetical protein